MTNLVTFKTVAGLTSSALRATGFGLMFLAVGGVASAAVPEIDPGSMSSGVALLAAGVLWLSGRRPRK